jgi:hypothetical protein
VLVVGHGDLFLTRWHGSLSCLLSPSSGGVAMLGEHSREARSSAWSGTKVARAGGALDRRPRKPPDYDHPVDAAGVARLLRLGVRRLALAFGCWSGITAECPGGKERACLPVRQ